MKLCFDTNTYVFEQSQKILERLHSFDKFYLECGGKLIGDTHAKRVLPGFEENAKMKVLEQIREQAEVIICVYAGDIEKKKMRNDLGIRYDEEVLRLIDVFRTHHLELRAVVITRYQGQPSVEVFIHKLERRGIKVYKHYPTTGYPTDIDTIVSEEGFGANPYIETNKPIVIVAAPGPNSGKLSTCLSQLYHEYRLGKKAGYSKYETFPVWNLPLKHPLNVAYEAATVDLKDVNMIDVFHLEKYQTTAVNYNRDLKLFPVLRKIIEKITKTESLFQSPTDMGVNCIAKGIIDDEGIKFAAKQEIIRRYFKCACDFQQGLLEQDILERMKFIMEELELKAEDRKVVVLARNYCAKHQHEQDQKCQVVALELSDGRGITGKFSSLMSGAAAVILNAIKLLAQIPDDVHLISPLVLEPILKLKQEILHTSTPSLNAEEILIALSISAVTHPVAQYAMSKLSLLQGAQAHATVMLSRHDEQSLRKLGIELTSDPEYQSSSLYTDE